MGTVDLLPRLQERVPGNWDHVVRQIGMFSYTGLTPAQCKRLTERWHVYLTGDGRISMAGLSSSRVGYLAAAIKDVVLACPQ
jgi:aspartate/tyrosine/aromatic aminotransferase